MKVYHTFDVFYNEDSEILILGSMPSIKNIEVNDIKWLLDRTKIKKIFTLGKKSYELYNKYCLNDTGIEAICLYSTSPANCKITMEEMVENYQVINNGK